MEEKNISQEAQESPATGMCSDVESIFIDTNILMHCQPLEKIPLKSLVKSDNIKIIFTRFNITELNKNKDNPQQKKTLRERAKRQLDFIESLFVAGNTGTLDGIPVQMLLSDARPEDYELCSTTQDNIQIANILKYKSDGHNVYFFTNDTGAKICAQACGISCSKLSDYLLPEEDDPETIELKQLRKEIAELKNRRPVLALIDAERSSNDIVLQKVKINLSLHPKEETPHYENPKLIAKFDNRFDLSSMAGLLSLNKIYDDSELNRWERDVEKYTQEYEEYKKTVSFVSSLQISKISISLKNSGKCKASHIILKLVFPEELTVLDNIDEFENIKPPKAPVPPKKRYDFLPRSFSPDVLSSLYERPKIMLNYSLEEQDNHFNFEEKFKYLLQNTQAGIHELFVINPPNGFSVSYELLAEELPEPQKGLLNIHY